MSPTLKSAVLFGSLFVITKLLLFNTGLHEQYYVLVVFANILFVLMSMIFGLRADKQTHPEKRTYTDDVKSTMRSAASYAIIVSAFAYLYYSSIDKAFTEKRIQEKVELAEKADFAALQKMNPEKLGNLNREDFIDSERENAKLWFNPFFISTVTLIGLIILSLFYSFLIAWFWRRFVDQVERFEER